MQIGKVELSERVEPILPGLKELFDFVKKTDWSKMPAGITEIDGKNVFVRKIETCGKPADEQKLEAHRQYVDVQILLEGNEAIGWIPTEEVKTYTQEYNAEKDVILSTEKPRYYVDMKPGEYCILFPEDAHAPTVGDGPIVKLVGKVKL